MKVERQACGATLSSRRLASHQMTVVLCGHAGRKPGGRRKAWSHIPGIHLRSDLALSIENRVSPHFNIAHPSRTLPLHFYTKCCMLSCRSERGMTCRPDTSTFRKARWTCSSSAPWRSSLCMAGPSPSASNRFRARCCASNKVRSIRRCIVWNAGAGSKPAGERPTTTAAPNITSSQKPAASSSK